MKSLRDLMTVAEVAKVLGIYKKSAKELMDGIIDFEINELIDLAEYKGISLKEISEYVVKK